MNNEWDSPELQGCAFYGNLIIVNRAEGHRVYDLLSTECQVK